MRYIALVLIAMLAGCTTTGSPSGNHEYTRNCGYAMDQLGLCGGYPHEF